MKIRINGENMIMRLTIIGSFSLIAAVLIDRRSPGNLAGGDYC